MTTAKTATQQESPSKGAASKAPVKSPAKKPPATHKPAKKTAEEGNHCWPGFEPTPGKMAGTKSSCQPKPGKQSPAVKKADAKAAAASKLQKRGKPNPK